MSKLLDSKPIYTTVKDLKEKLSELNDDDTLVITSAVFIKPISYYGTEMRVETILHANKKEPLLLYTNKEE